MTCAKIVRQLKSLGTAQNRKVMARHGAPPNYAGVSFANIEKIRKQIVREYKKDTDQQHQFAMKLWEADVCEAKILATMLADPHQLTKTRARQMIKPVNYFMLSNYLGGLFARADFAVELMEEQMRSKKEFIRHNGYDILLTILKNGQPKLAKQQCQDYLKQLETDIHNSPNRSRSAMNWALIGMGTYRDDMYKKVVAAAKRIGKVDVDHGETNCKTPDAIAYIAKSRAHRAKKK